MPRKVDPPSEEGEAARSAAKRELDEVGKSLPKTAIGRGDSDVRREDEAGHRDTEPA